MRGIPAVAINEDTIRRASDQSRDLFEEVLEGKFALVIVSPEMLTGHRFGQLIRSPNFQKWLSLVFIDECHLVEEQGAEFRLCYKSIGELRARLPTSAPWIAVSATLPKASFDHVMKSLGFRQGRYVHASRPIDNKNICYIPRFYSYPTSSDVFLDLAWLIPSNINSISSITKTLVFCDTIALSARVYRFLNRLLPQSLSSSEAILVYHSLISDKGRSHTMERFKSGTTRIVVATDCFTWGVDVADIRNVVVFGLPSSFSKLVQRIGRAGRDKEQAYAIAYAPPWVKDVPEDSSKGAKHKDAERRQKMCPVLFHWFNPTEACCSRDVLCLNFGDTPSCPRNCCIIHHKNLPNLNPDQATITAFTPQHTKAPAIRSDGTYHPFNKKEDKSIRLSISHIISIWTQQTWARVTSSNTLLPPTSFLSQALQNRLCDKFHTITSPEKLSLVLAGWPHLKQYKDELYGVCELALKEFQEMRKQRREPDSMVEDLEDSDNFPEEDMVESDNLPEVFMEELGNSEKEVMEEDFSEAEDQGPLKIRIRLS